MKDTTRTGQRFVNDAAELAKAVEGAALTIKGISGRIKVTWEIEEDQICVSLFADEFDRPKICGPCGQTFERLQIITRGLALSMGKKAYLVLEES